MKYRILILTITILSTTGIKAQQINIAGSLNSFSFDMYKQLKSDNENLFFSPFSIDIALLMTREGAKSDTKSGFDKVLHVDSNVNSKLVRDFILNIKSFKDSSNRLNVSNAIWINRYYKIKTDFQYRIQTNYFAEAFRIDFLDQNKAANKINRWAALKTNNLIKNIISLDQFTIDLKLILTNVIYFIDKWDKPFERYLTKEDVFYGVNSETTKTDFMHETGLMNYFENGDFQFIAKYYKGNDKSFCVILPKTRYGISAIESVMDKSLFDSIFNHVASIEVDLSIPKFKMEKSYSLNKSLSNLGLKKAFTTADFTGISTTSRLQISKVTHKTFIEVSEEKTEAAAVTTVSYSDGLMPVDDQKPKPKEFKANHPFIFMIIDSKTKGIIFMGRYVNAQE